MIKTFHVVSEPTRNVNQLGVMTNESSSQRTIYSAGNGGRGVYTVKIPVYQRTSLQRVFHILMEITEPVSYTFVSVTRRNNEARALQCIVRALLLRRFTDADAYGTAVPLKYGKLAAKYPCIYGHFSQRTASHRYGGEKQSQIALVG